jgi:hypothetical protein
MNYKTHASAGPGWIMMWCLESSRSSEWCTGALSWMSPHLGQYRRASYLGWTGLQRESFLLSCQTSQKVTNSQPSVVYWYEYWLFREYTASIFRAKE